jgi:signal transduction histidine kinase
MDRKSFRNRERTKAQLNALDVTLEKQVENQTAVLEEMIRTLEAEHLEHLQTEQQLRAAHALLERRTVQLQALAAELTRAEQRERRRLAQLLHDHLQQLLVAARHRLRILQGNSQDIAVAGAAKEVDAILEQCLCESRLLTIELSPPVLYLAGLSAALVWLGDQMCERHGLAVTVQSDREAEPVDESIRLLLFQAVRELLFNVVKHARVDRARVTMTRTPSRETRIEVFDAGAGFDPSHVEASAGPDGGFGLFSIRERLGLLGGQIEIRSAPGKGTRAVIRVPLGLNMPSRR